MMKNMGMKKFMKNLAFKKQKVRINYQPLQLTIMMRNSHALKKWDIHDILD